MSIRPKYYWHELLAPINREGAKSQRAFDSGKSVHARVEAIIGNHSIVEQEYTYDDPELPFIIGYHPDLLRQEIALDGSVRTYVYEIKPLAWYLKNRTYCEAQASGYAYFTGARARALAYRREHKDEIAESKRAYYREHKDEIAESKRAYYREHKDEIAESKRAYYREHKDEIAESQRARLASGRTRPASEISRGASP